MRKVLVSAYACEPGRGSEGEIGWSLVLELAKSNEVWVLTRANNRAVHDAAFASSDRPASLHFIYYDLPAWTRWYKKGKRLFLLYYYHWQIGSYFEARRFLRSQPVDLVHHLTGGMDWMPSGLAFLGRPFVWGPVGSERIHPVINRVLPPRVRIKEAFRAAIHFCFRHLDPLVRATGRNATVILSHTPEHMPARYRSKVHPYVQTGIHPNIRFAQLKTDFRRGEAFTIIYAGELVHWKGARHAVDAFCEFARGTRDARLLVIGSGPLRDELKAQVRKDNLQDRVQFSGRLTMGELVRALGSADVFLYPSYHHGLATVVLQAMLTGLPIVCLEGDAIGRTVGTEAGVTVPLESDTHFIQGLAGALRQLHADEGWRSSLAVRAQEIALTKFAYQALGRGYERIYRIAVPGAAAHA